MAVALGIAALAADDTVRAGYLAAAMVGMVIACKPSFPGQWLPSIRTEATRIAITVLSITTSGLAVATAATVGTTASVTLPTLTLTSFFSGIALDVTPQIDEGNSIMLHVHHHGVGECGVFTYEVAETKVTQVMDFARKHQHPLQCIMEKK